MDSSHLRCIFFKDPYTGQIFEEVFAKDQFIIEPFDLNRGQNTRRFRTYRYRFILTKTEISIEEIDMQETGLGLIGPGTGCLARPLQTLFRWLSTF